MVDPNAALAELRDLHRAWEAAGSRGPWSEAQADRAIELARDLDAWLSRGGFLPDAWRAASRPAHSPLGSRPGPRSTPGIRPVF